MKKELTALKPLFILLPLLVLGFLDRKSVV